MGKVSGLEKAIELKRKELNQAGNRNDLCSEVMLMLSQELDELLNKFSKIKRGIKRAAC